MASSDTAKLIASLELKDKFSKPLTGANRALASFDAKLSQTQGRAFKAGQQIGTGIKNGLKIATVAVGLLATQVFAGLNQLVKLESITAATNTVLLSTKAVSGQTAAGVRALSEEFENLNATMDDKVIQSGANMLLTFTNIRRQAFEPALEAALNLNEAMGGGEEGLQGNIIKVGKALNDPIKGLTALSKVGVAFTVAQKEQVKQLVGTGDALKDLKIAQVALTKEQKDLVRNLAIGTTGLDAAAAAGIKLDDTQKALLTTIADGSGLLKAQNIILAELGTEFGGRFRAQGKTGAATIAAIGDAVEDLQKGLAIGLYPTIQKLLPRLREFLISPAFTKGAMDLGDAIAGLFTDKNITEGTNALKGLFQIAKDAAPALQNAAEITGRVIGTAVDLFRSLPPEIQALAVAGLAINKLTGGLVTNIAGGLISSVLKQLVSGVVNVNGGVVNVVGGAGGAGVPGVGGAGGVVPFLAGVAAIPVAVIAFGSKAAADLANAEFAAQGVKSNFVAPDPGLGTGLISAFQNIAEILRITQGGGKLSDPGRSPDVADAVKDAAASERAALLRNARIVAGATDSAKRGFIGAIQSKDLTARVAVSVRSSPIYFNGRLLQAAVNRHSSVVGHSITGGGSGSNAW